MSIQVGQAIGKRIEAGSKSRMTSILGKAEGSDHPERQRGLWSFLTWSFYLANFLTAAAIDGGAARAATIDAESGSRPSGDEPSTSTLPRHDIMPAVLETFPAAGPLQTNEMLSSNDPLGAPSFDAQPAYVNNVLDPLGGASGSGAGRSGGVSGYSGGSSTVNNFFSTDSHDVSITNINSYLSIDSHGVDEYRQRPSTLQFKFRRRNDSRGDRRRPRWRRDCAAGERTSMVDTVVSVTEAVVADAGEVAGSLTSAVEEVVTTALDETVSAVAEAGGIATALLESVSSTR